MGRGGGEGAEETLLSVSLYFMEKLGGGGLKLDCTRLLAADIWQNGCILHIKKSRYNAARNKDAKVRGTVWARVRTRRETRTRQHAELPGHEAISTSAARADELVEKSRRHFVGFRVLFTRNATAFSTLCARRCPSLASSLLNLYYKKEVVTIL